MPRTGTILRVFVASPNDVAEERNFLEEIVKELNQTWSQYLGITLDLIRWETQAYPDVGTDGQAVINEQIGDDYDIFVGILWKRFGTPTGRAGSGTEEEFERAYERFRTSNNDLRIMFYFKDAPVPPSEMDPSQLDSINRFRIELGERGTLFWSYKTLEDFGSLTRMHLSRQVQNWGSGWGVGRLPKAESADTVDGVDDDRTADLTLPQGDEDEGFLDLIDQGQERFETLDEVVTRMTSEVGTLGRKMTRRSQEFGQLQSSRPDQIAGPARRIAKRSAEDMEQFVVRMKGEIPSFAESYSEGIDRFGRAATLLSDFGDEGGKQVEGALEVVRVLGASLNESMTSIVLRESVESLPRITTVFNRAKRNVVTIVDELIGEMRNALNLTSEIERMLLEAL